MRKTARYGTAAIHHSTGTGRDRQHTYTHGAIIGEALGTRRAARLPDEPADAVESAPLASIQLVVWGRGWLERVCGRVGWQK